MIDLNHPFFFLLQMYWTLDNIGFSFVWVEMYINGSTLCIFFCNLFGSFFSLIYVDVCSWNLIFYWYTIFHFMTILNVYILFLQDILINSKIFVMLSNATINIKKNPHEFWEINVSLGYITENMLMKRICKCPAWVGDATLLYNYTHPTDRLLLTHTLANINIV